MRRFEPTNYFKNNWMNNWMATKTENLKLSINSRLSGEEIKEIEKDWNVFWEAFKPKRSTKGSAGYDIRASEKVVIEPFFESMFNKLIDQKEFKNLSEINDGGSLMGDIRPVVVSTGIKAYMEEDEVLKLYNRSSNPYRRGLILVNGTGIIDSDYADSDNMGGEILFQFYNFSPYTITIKKGDRIGQAVFTKYLKTDDDYSDKERNGGHGSTGDR